VSTSLLLSTKQHIIDVGGLLGAYSVKYYRWSDANLKGGGSVALFRMTGTSGATDHQQQQPDVSLFLMAAPALVTQADADMLAVLQYLRADFSSANVFAFHPLQGYTGPNYLENGRATFEMVIRCGVEDH
jgi:hypothetical protein